MKITLEDEYTKVIIETEAENAHDVVEKVFAPAMLGLTYQPNTVADAFYQYGEDRLPKEDDDV
jgi:hypothetical protein